MFRISLTAVSLFIITYFTKLTSESSSYDALFIPINNLYAFWMNQVEPLAMDTVTVQNHSSGLAVA